MCGIGILVANKLHSSFYGYVEKELIRMADRGPDASKTQIINNHIVAGHTRLAINGLSQEFNQPYSTDNEHYLIFNGEIYNFRDDFPRYKSDTKYLYDNLVAANGDIEKIKVFLSKCDAVWAFSFISPEYIIISRDIFGEKPLYRHTERNNKFVYFSSLAEFNSNNDCNSVIFPSNTITKIMLNDQNNERSIKIFNYNKSIKNQQNEEFQIGFEKILEASIKKRLDCDVPIACTLSGGLDSSVIALLANRYSNGKITFFTSVPDSGESELTYAKYVTDSLNKNLEVLEYNTEMYFQKLKDNLEIFPKNIKSPSSIIHLILMEKIRSEGYKVCLDGQGADEYLGGYRFQTVEWLLSKFKTTFKLKYILKLLSLLLKDKQFSLYYYTLKKIFKKDVHNCQAIIQNSLFREPLPSLLSYTDFVSMKNSIEIRTPFLSISLINFTRFHKGFDFDYPYTKPVLRNILNKNKLDFIANRKDKLGYELPWVEMCHFLRSKEGRYYMPKFNIKQIFKEKVIFRYILFKFSIYLMPKIAIYSHFQLSRKLGFKVN